ncbi:MAG TPA: fibronectin type III domain-containing protein [Prolixibacteraceae bacterium]|nr:fibronectin type III domain-containing protein [Prolixibacteraceae bacterium]
MNRKLRKQILIVLGVLLMLQPAKSQTPTMQVAANLDGSELEYINLVKQYPEWFFTQDWGGYGGRITRDYHFQDWSGNIIDLKPYTLPLTTDGSYYPRYAPIMANNGYNIYPQLWINCCYNGTYTVMADGKGTLEFAMSEGEHFFSDSTTCSFSNGITFTFTIKGVTAPDNSGFPATTGSGPGGMGSTPVWLQITKSDSLNPIRNIRILPPDYTDAKGVVHHFANEYQTHPFHPKLIEDLQKYTAIRCMDLCQTNNSEVKYWDQMRHPNELGSGTTPSIDLITLANEANRDLWLNIPHQATNGFADTLALLIKNNLKPGLKAYIEYSNEVWNSIFDQTGWAEQQGMVFGWSDNPGGKYYVRRSGELFKRFSDRFAGERNRLLFVCAWQVGSGNEALGEYYNDPLINPGGVKPDAFAVAPYFYRIYTQDDIGVIGECLWQDCDSCKATKVPSVDEVLGTMRNSIRTNVTEGLKYSRMGADKYHIPLINYEGGPHAVGTWGAENSCTLTDHLAKANRSNEMYTIYQEWMDTVCASGVQLLNQFVDRSGWSKWGCWGLEEYRGQDEASPKYRALVDWEKKHPVVLDTLPPSKPGKPTKESATSTSVTISWKASADNGMIIGYDLFLNGQFYGSSNCQENNRQYTLIGLTASTQYTLSVKARDFGGNYSPESDTLMVKTNEPDTQKPMAVINLKLIQKTCNEVLIRWSPSYDNDNADQYLVDWGDSKDTTSEVSYRIRNLAPEKEYTIRVMALDPSGNVSDASYLTLTTDPFPVVQAHQTYQKINMNGNPDETAWKKDFRVSKLLSYSSVADNDRITIGLLWDNNYLYLGAEVIDSSLQTGYSYWYGDGFEIVIDGNHNHSRSFEEGYDVKYTLQWNNNTLNGENISGVNAASIQTNNGWNCEVAIPWSKLGITTPEEGMELGFDLIYDDCDASIWGRDRQYTLLGDESIYSSCEGFAHLKLSSDTIPPASPLSVAVGQITMGSATVSWNAPSDKDGIMGYYLFIDGKQINSDWIPSTFYTIEGLKSNTRYTVSVIAVDKSYLQSTPASTTFTTNGGNQLIHFNAPENTTESYETQREAQYQPGSAIIPFSTGTGSELFGEIAGYQKQYDIKGGFRYEYHAEKSDNTNFPTIRRKKGESEYDGVLYVYTGDTVASNFTGILMWSKDKFLNGNDQYRNIAFDQTANSRLKARISPGDEGNIRFVVKANGNYYLSEKIFDVYRGSQGYEDFELTGFGNNGNIDKRWAAFDPEELTMPKENQINFQPVELSSVEEIGLIFSVGRPKWAYSFGLIDFSAWGIQKSNNSTIPPAPSVFTLIETTESSCSFSWEPTDDTMNDGCYRVYVRNETGEYILAGITYTPSFSINNLRPSELYYFKVQTVDLQGNRSEMSEPFSVRLRIVDGTVQTGNHPLHTWPNPATEKLYVDVSPLQGNSPISLTITDLTGRVYTRQTIGTKEKILTIPVSSLERGIYLMVIETNKQRKTAKVVIE